jgi:hypothetical protein
MVYARLYEKLIQRIKALDGPNVGLKTIGEFDARVDILLTGLRIALGDVT